MFKIIKHDVHVGLKDSYLFISLNIWIPLYPCPSDKLLAATKGHSGLKISRRVPLYKGNATEAGILFIVLFLQSLFPWLV